MKSSTLRHLFAVGALSALVSLHLHAQVVEFHATINAAQETPPTSSGATGSAIYLYDMSANAGDLIVTVSNFPNTLTASHFHEAALGVAGAVVTNLGAEAFYSRSGNTLTATFKNVAYGGDRTKLLANGAYINFHTAAFPSGEVRGQLIAQTKRFTAIIGGGQETPVNNSQAYGAAILNYNPGTNKFSILVNLYNMTNTITASHIHEAAAGVAGPVKNNFGDETIYTRKGNALTTSFVDVVYNGDPVKLLTSGAYVNFHSAAFPSGEIRGQLIPSDEIKSSRLVNSSARGFVGTGTQNLVVGFSVTGPEPVRVLVTAKGPSLANFGITGALADPVLNIFDTAGRTIATSDNIGTVAAGNELLALPFSPTNPNESAAFVILPPGNYTAAVSGANNTTGIALVETYDVRGATGLLLAAADTTRMTFQVAGTPAAQRRRIDRSKLPLELCGAPVVASK